MGNIKMIILLVVITMILCICEIHNTKAVMNCEFYYLKKIKTSCFSLSDKKMIRKEISHVGQNINYGKNTIEGYIVNKNECIVLYFVKGKVKSKQLNYLIPVLKDNSKILVNTKYIEGKALSTDTIFLIKGVEIFINENVQKFTLSEMDSIRKFFSYGIQYEPIYNVNWKK